MGFLIIIGILIFMFGFGAVLKAGLGVAGVAVFGLVFAAVVSWFVREVW